MKDREPHFNIACFDAKGHACRIETFKYIIVKIPPKWYFLTLIYGPYSYGLNPRCRMIVGLVGVANI